jgi:hypothetical protein
MNSASTLSAPDSLQGLYNPGFKVDEEAERRHTFGSKSVPSVISPRLIQKALQVPVDRGRVHQAVTKDDLDKSGAPATALATMQSKWMDVTPAMAAQWLQRNFKNRPLSPHTVKAYARDMIGGVWVPTHQGIAFNVRDELMDGQHRLSAIVLSGVMVRMMVTFGMPAKIEGKAMTAMDAVDRGRPRSVADQLKMQHGLKDGTHIAAICLSIGSLCYGERTARLSVEQTLQIFYLFEKSIRWVIENRPKQPGLRQTGVLAAFAFALNSADEETTSRLMTLWVSLTTGKGLFVHTPIAQLHRFLTGSNAILFTKGMTRGLMELVLQALHLELFGEDDVLLAPSLDGAQRFLEANAEWAAKVAALFKLHE